MLSEIRTGEVRTSEGAVNPARGGRLGELILGPGMAEYHELARLGRLFTAGNQGPAGTATTVGLAAAHTGLCLSNPQGSLVNLIPLLFGIAVPTAPVALATIGLLGGFLAAGVTVHTTPLAPISTILGGPAGIAKVDAAATLPGTPTLLMPLGVTPITGATAQVVNPPVNLQMFDLKGAFVIPPGGYIGSYTSTVLGIIAAILWAEYPI